ncbi:MAG: protease modulator HflC [Pseudomonadota bacterium]
MSKSQGPVWLIFFLLLGALYSTIFTVDQTEQALIVQLGEPQGQPLGPGFHVKVPLVQKAVFFDTRLLYFSPPPVDVLTADKKNLLLTVHAQWKIVDPLVFYVTVGDEPGAQARLNDLILAEIRTEVGRFSLNEAAAGARRDILKNVTARVGEAAKTFGVGVVDVHLERLGLPRENEQAVFENMRSERDRQARKHLAEGRELAAGIKAAAEKEATIIRAEAYRKAQEIKGRADAEAAGVYSAAFGRDPDFYNFTRTLELYRRSLDHRATLFLSRDDELMWLMKSRGTQPPRQP